MQARGGDAGLVLPAAVIQSSRQLTDIRMTVTNPTLQFPFLLDQNTVSHVKRTKVMFLLRGAPGSGKSTLAEILNLKYPGSVVCSADNYFVGRNGVYRWDRRKLPEAHESCHLTAEKTCGQGRILIVDNSNVRIWEMDFYFQLAQRHSYVVVLVETKTSWRHDVDQLADRTIHDVASGEIEHKLRSFKVAIPNYFGWFLNEVDSMELLRIGQKYLSKCSRIPQFRKAYQHMDVLQYYSNYSLGNGSNILHCTACYCDHGDLDAAEDYACRDCVRKWYGKAMQLSVIGFVITPRTFGARVKLSDQDLPLWNQDDLEQQTPQKGGGRQRHADDDVRHLAESLSVLQVSGAAGGTGSGSRGSRSRQQNPTSCTWRDSDVPAAQFFKPCKGRGSRAHITLGCAADVEPVQTGFDQIEIVRLENRRPLRPPVAENLDKFSCVCNYGEGRWVVYLRTQLTMMALFTGCY